MNKKQYKFQNIDGEEFPETFNSIKDAVRECSDFRTYKIKSDGGYYTRENGFIFPVEAEN